MKRNILLTFLSAIAFALIALVALGAGVAQAQQYNIDHYLVYKILNPTYSGLRADLQDQFGMNQVILWERDKFANPVAKTHPPELPDPEDIIFPDEHLSWWRFEEPQPYQGEVLVSNQFGPDQHLTLGPAEYLLVPAIKDGIGTITVNQHDVCYAVTEAQPIEIDVSLADQFGMRPAVVGTARYLCNPVNKLGPIPLEPSGPPMYPEDHLVCYDIDQVPVDEIRGVQDQVAAQGFLVELIRSDMLCLPSSKQHVESESIPTVSERGMIIFSLLLLGSGLWVMRRKKTRKST